MVVKRQRKKTEVRNKRKNGTCWEFGTWSGNYKKELGQLLSDWVMWFCSVLGKQEKKNKPPFSSKHLNSVAQPPVAAEVAC